MTKVAVIGLGYVGLPLLCAIAKSEKYNVVGFDISEKQIDKINNKICPIEDAQCEADMKKVNYAVSSKQEILEGSDIFIICVPTPINGDYSPNYKPVIGATEIVSKYLKQGNSVIIESTINPGTCEEVVLPILGSNTQMKGGKDFVLAHCPERINPGDPKWNVYNIPRNIGTLNNYKSSEIAEFYKSFLNAEVNIVNSIKVAEATKIIENTFRDINIAYVNELAKSFDAMGIDLNETIKGASNKPFGFMPHFPGCGVGGHCIAVDPYYLIKRAELSGFNHQFLKIARDVNNSMPKYTVERLEDALNDIQKSINGTKIALLGLSYKANVGDLRESPALHIKKELEIKKADLVVFDPFTSEKNTFDTLDATMEDAEAVVLCTSHTEFIEKLTGDYLKKHNIKVVIDGRNCLNKEDIIMRNIIYKGIGR